MRAWRVHELGKPADVLQLDDVDPAHATEGEVLIDVEAVGLNFPDLLLCQGLYQERPPLPFTPGLEVSGTVVEAGTSELRPGQRVIAAPPLPHGGLAEQIAAPASEVFAIPDSLDFPDAAALHLAYQTAHVGLHRRAQLRAGETLLVHGATGSTGSAAVQLGAAAGARVIATAGGAHKVEAARRLGADEVIDHRESDFVAAVKDLTGGRGADVIFDPVGGEVFERSVRCVAFEGRVLVIGFAGGGMAQAKTNHLLIKNYAVVGLHWGLYRQKLPALIPETHAALLELHERGAIAPLVHSALPMASALEGYAAISDREVIGKVVVHPRH